MIPTLHHIYQTAICLLLLLSPLNPLIDELRHWSLKIFFVLDCLYLISFICYFSKVHASFVFVVLLMMRYTELFVHTHAVHANAIFWVNLGGSVCCLQCLVMIFSNPCVML